MLHSGYSKTNAFMLNIMSSFATLVGGMLAYVALHSMQDMVPTLLAFAAASMICVAVADLIPGLHRRAELTATAQQIVLIALGIGTVYLSHKLLDHLVLIFEGYRARRRVAQGQLLDIGAWFSIG